MLSAAHEARYAAPACASVFAAASAGPLHPDCVVWAITAPALWGEPAKERLRAAAQRAGAGGALALALTDGLACVGLP